MSVRSISDAAELLTLADAIRPAGFQHGPEWQGLLARSCGLSARNPRYLLSGDGDLIALCQPPGRALLPGLRELQACSSLYTTEWGAGLES